MVSIAEKKKASLYISQRDTLRDLRLSKDDKQNPSHPLWARVFTFTEGRVSKADSYIIPDNACSRLHQWY